MLVLSRKVNENLMIGDSIKVTVVEIRGDKARIGVEAPSFIPVHRQEIYDAIKREGLVSVDTESIARTEEQIRAMAAARGLLLNGDALLKIEALAQMFETIIACGRQKVAVGE